MNLTVVTTTVKHKDVKQDYNLCIGSKQAVRIIQVIVSVLHMDNTTTSKLTHSLILATNVNSVKQLLCVFMIQSQDQKTSKSIQNAIANKQYKHSFD